METGEFYVLGEDHMDAAFQAQKLAELFNDQLIDVIPHAKTQGWLP